MNNDSNSDATNANSEDDRDNDYNHQNTNSHGLNRAGHNIKSNCRGKNNHHVGNKYDIVNNDSDCDNKIHNDNNTHAADDSSE